MQTFTDRPREEATLLAWRVLELVFELRNMPVGSGSEMPPGDGYHAERIEAFVRAGKTIEMVLPAFPAKSSNRQKTLGDLPDLGEALALKRLDRLCAAIGEIYEPGARIVICSDGRVFSDLVQVSDQAVSLYREEISRILARERLSHLGTFDLDDVFDAGLNHDQRREALVGSFAEPVERLRERVAEDEEFRQLFNGIHRFLFEDLIVLRPGLSRNQAREASKQLAYGVVQRSNAWSRLVEQRFPEAVRLSIHPQAPNSRKIGVRLLPSSNVWRTPWHSAVLFDGREYSLVRRKDAEDRRAVLMRDERGYPYYVVPEAVQGGKHARAIVLQ